MLPQPAPRSPWLGLRCSRGRGQKAKHALAAPLSLVPGSMGPLRPCSRGLPGRHHGSELRSPDSPMTNGASGQERPGQERPGAPGAMQPGNRRRPRCAQSWGGWSHGGRCGLRSAPSAHARPGVRAGPRQPRACTGRSLVLAHREILDRTCHVHAQPIYSCCQDLATPLLQRVP
jgi:hypothetical protein